MKTALLTATLTCLICSSVLAREDGKIEIKYYLNTGKADSFELKFKGPNASIKTNDKKVPVTLSEAQQKPLLAAIQAEAKRYVVAPRSFPSLQMDAGSVVGEHIKLQFKHKAAGSELEIELNIPFDAPSGLSKEMYEIIKQYFNIDLSTPKRPPAAK